MLRPCKKTKLILPEIMEYRKLSTKDFEKIIIANRESAILVFGASWSGNSEIMDSMMERLSSEFSAYVSFYKIDIEEQKVISDFFNVHSVPTTVMVQKGEVIDMVRGFLPASKIRKKINASFDLKSAS